MAIKHYKPTTNGLRNMTTMDYSCLSKVEPERSLLEPLKKNAGRNSYGRITVRHRGGGNRRKYRVIDFKRNRFGIPATVMTLEYDPNRSAFIALIQYEDGVKSYIIAPVGLKVGDVIAIKEESKSSEKIKAVIDTTASRAVPKWLDLDNNTLTGKVVAVAEREDIDLPLEEHLIVEFYSR